jgi:hypothetical protein
MAGATPAVRFYSEDHPALARTLRVKLDQYRDTLITALGDGLAQDFADYRYRAGKIAGLKDAIDLCEQAEKETEN